jgi:hypothetical protein
VATGVEGLEAEGTGRTSGRHQSLCSAGKSGRRIHRQRHPKRVSGIRVVVAWFGGLLLAECVRLDEDAVSRAIVG